MGCFASNRVELYLLDDAWTCRGTAKQACLLRVQPRFQRTARAADRCVAWQASTGESRVLAQRDRCKQRTQHRSHPETWVLFDHIVN